MAFLMSKWALQQTSREQDNMNADINLLDSCTLLVLRQGFSTYSDYSDMHFWQCEPCEHFQHC